MVSCMIRTRTVSSEAMNTIKFDVYNFMTHCDSDTAAVCHETKGTTADTACHHLPESTWPFA